MPNLPHTTQRYCDGASVPFSELRAQMLVLVNRVSQRRGSDIGNMANRDHNSVELDVLKPRIHAYSCIASLFCITIHLERVGWGSLFMRRTAYPSNGPHTHYTSEGGAFEQSLQLSTTNTSRISSKKTAHDTPPPYRGVTRSSSTTELFVLRNALKHGEGLFGRIPRVAVSKPGS